MTLQQHRHQIDQIDKQLLELLEKRFEISKKIGQHKKENGIKIHQPEREKQIIESKTQRTQLPKEFIKELFQLIFKQSKEVQK